MKMYNLSAADIVRGVRAGTFSAEACAAGVLDRIRAVEPDVRAFLHWDPDAVMQRAEELDRLPADTKARLPLLGVPVAVKDNMLTRQMPTTAGSRILGGFRSPYDATVVERIEQAGAIVVGKTNLDEFAMGSSTEHSAFQVTRNPWDVSRVPGGSSGGSAAAVAARMVPLALGSDTGGSIRQPAAFCGVMGLKPTYGRVSRYGLIAFASSLDQIGPFARTVEDMALMMQVIAGPDPRDSTALDAPAPAFRPRPGGLAGLRIGLPAEYYGEGIDPRIRDVMDQTLDRLRDLGVELVPISLPHTAYAIATYYLVAPAEASSNLSRYDGVRYGLRVADRDLVTMYEETRAEGFGDEVKRRILLGTHALSAGYYDAYYLKAQKVRSLIRQDFEQAFRSVDFVVTPTTPDLPFTLGERSDDPLKMYLSDIFTVTANLAGIPGVSVPAGLADGLPVGLQWLAPALAEEALLGAVHEFCRHLPPVSWPMEEDGDGR